MKKVVAVLACVAVLLVGYVVLDKSGIQSSFDTKKAYDQGKAFYNNKEYDRAAELFKKVCDGGEMRGCNNLGVMYTNGDGVEKNEQKAAELYKKACNGGETNGCYNLGLIYADGKGVEKDFKKAAELFKKACDGGNMHGCRSLDIIHMLMAK